MGLWVLFKLSIFASLFWYHSGRWRGSTTLLLPGENRNPGILGLHWNPVGRGSWLLLDRLGWESDFPLGLCQQYSSWQQGRYSVTAFHMASSDTLSVRSVLWRVMKVLLWLLWCHSRVRVRVHVPWLQLISDGSLDVLLCFRQWDVWGGRIFFPGCLVGIE